MGCLHYRPGEILRLRSVSKGKDEAHAKGSGFGLARVREVLDLGRNLVLERIVGSPGDEQRMLATLREPQGVLSTSLNYLGVGSASAAANVLGAPVEIETYLFDDGVRQAEAAAFSSDIPKVLVVDPSPQHCREVMTAVACGIATLGAKGSAVVVGACLPHNTAQYVDFFAMLKVLARAVLNSRHLYAINISVDFGVLCMGTQRAGGENPLPEQLATAAYSFPIFEQVLQIVLESNRIAQPSPTKGEGKLTPAIFAPAGNRDGEPRWRMAYPAVRPEVIAATFVTQCEADAARPLTAHESADIPATSGVRLCMALDADLIRESGSPVNGTSFACAWLAGAYTGLSLREPNLAAAPPIGKQAYLFQRARRRAIETTRHSWIAPQVHLFERQGDILHSSALQRTLRELNEQHPGVEFMLTGSAALVDAWLTKHDLRYREVFAKATTPSARDFDVTFFGSMAAVRVHKLVETKIRGLFESEFLMRGPAQRFARSFDVRSIEDRVTGTALMQSVIPACDIHLTGWGWLDAWGGLDELKRGQLSISIPPRLEAWDLNPQFVDGSNGAALGILIWANAILLLSAIATEVRLPQLAPTPVPASLRAVTELLDRAANQSEIDGQQAFTLLFGRRPRREGHIALRARRAKELGAAASNSANGAVRDLRNMVDRLDELRLGIR